MTASRAVAQVMTAGSGESLRHSVDDMARTPSSQLRGSTDKHWKWCLRKLNHRHENCATTSPAGEPTLQRMEPNLLLHCSSLDDHRTSDNLWRQCRNCSLLTLQIPTTNRVRHDHVSPTKQSPLEHIPRGECQQIPAGIHEDGDSGGVTAPHLAMPATWQPNVGAFTWPSLVCTFQTRTKHCEDLAQNWRVIALSPLECQTQSRL